MGDGLGLRRVPRRQAQLADAVAKYTPELMYNMAAFLRNPTFCLVDTQDFADDNTGVAAQREQHVVGRADNIKKGRAQVAAAQPPLGPAS